MVLNKLLLFYYGLVSLIFIGCKGFSEKNEISKNTNNSKVNFDSISRRYYEGLEISSLKEVQKNDLISVYNKCLYLIYQIYATEFAYDSKTSDKVNISECDIRLIMFKNNQFTFELFRTDSLPFTYDSISGELGGLLNTFKIDEKKKIVSVSDNGIGWISAKNVWQLYLAAVNKSGHSKYIGIGKLHPKFKRLLLELIDDFSIE